MARSEAGWVTTAWTDICSCNICIHHIHVDYTGGRWKNAPTFAPFSTSCTSAVAETPKLQEEGAVTVGLRRRTIQWNIKTFDMCA